MVSSRGDRTEDAKASARKGFGVVDSGRAANESDDTKEARKILERVYEEKCDAVYFLNHNELTESPAETLKTQIANLSMLEIDLRNLIEEPVKGHSFLGHGFKLVTTSSIAVLGVSIGFALKNVVIGAVVTLLFVVIASVVFVGWDGLCCQVTTRTELNNFLAHFTHVRRMIQTARRRGHLRSNREWEVTSALQRDKPARKFWRQAFGHDVTRVPIKRFEKAVVYVLEQRVKVMDAQIAMKTNHEEQNNGELTKGMSYGPSSDAANIVKGNDHEWSKRLEQHKTSLRKLIQVCMGASMHPVVTPARFRSLLLKLGPFDRLLFNMMDLIDERSASSFKEWFFPVPLTKADLVHLGEKVSHMKEFTELPWMCFFVHPAANETQFHDHSFCLVRYTKSATRFADDIIYRSIFGFHVSMTGPELRKVFQHEARIAEVVAEVTQFPSKVLDILVDLITVAPPVFDAVSDLITFYRDQNKLSVPAPFLRNFRHH